MRGAGRGQEVLSKRLGEITVPTVLVLVIMLFSLVVLSRNTLRIWLAENQKETQLGTKMLADKKRKQGGDGDKAAGGAVTPPEDQDEAGGAATDQEDQDE